VRAAPAGADDLARAEAARRDGNPLALYDRAKSAMEAGRTDPRFAYLQVLAAAQMGDVDRAEALYRRLDLGARTSDEDALALHGRLFKDRALTASGEVRRALFAQASGAYRRAFAVRSGYFPLINAATTAWAAGDHADARGLASRVLDHRDLNPPQDFFAAASRAEALILLGRGDEADAALESALASHAVRHGERASAFRQLQWLCADAPLSRSDRRAILDRLRPAPVFSFTGHMFQADPEAEAALRARIHAALDALGSSIAYGSLACGADTVIAEAVLQRGGELHVVMPFLIEPFIESSVRPGGEAWVARFRTCMERASSVTFATRMDYIAHDSQFTYAAKLAAGIAQLRARQLAAEATQLAVWDGTSATEPSGTAVDIAAGRSMGLVTHIVPPGEIDRNLGNVRLGGADKGARHETRAILFTDYRGYSQLPESVIPTFVRRVMGRIAAVLDRHGEAVCSRNTWGDALYAVITDTPRAAAIALEIIEALEGVRFLAPPAGESEGMRIGLHYGPVYRQIDPVTGIDNFYGSEVTLTARIEPQAITGQIYTTQAFAAILATTAPDRFAARYVGRIELAKGYGVAPIYRLERGANPTPSTA